MVVSLLFTSICQAGVIFGDIAGNQTYSGYGVGPGGSANNSIAEGFTVTQTTTLASVEIYLSQFNSASGSNIALSIYSNSGGYPGTDLYDLSTNVTLPSLSGTPTLVTYTGTGAFTLTAGTTYWLNLYATNPSSGTGSNIQWDGVIDSGFNYVNPTGAGATNIGQLRSVGDGNPPTSTGSGTPATTGLITAFQLNSAVVPEPTSFALFGLGGIGLAVCRYSRRRTAT